MKFWKIISVTLTVVYLLLSVSIYGNDIFLCIGNNGATIETTVNANCNPNILNATAADAAIFRSDNRSTDNCEKCIDFLLTGVNKNSKYRQTSSKRFVALKIAVAYAIQPDSSPEKALLTADYFRKTSRIRRFTLEMLRTTVLIV